MLHRQSAEDAELGDLRAPRVDLRKGRERVLEFEDSRHVRARIRRLEGSHVCVALAATSLLAAPAPRVVDQDAAEHRGRGREEVFLALELFDVALGELDERLVHDGGGLQGVTHRLVPHEHRRQLLEPRIDALKQLRQRRLGRTVLVWQGRHWGTTAGNYTT